MCVLVVKCNRCVGWARLSTLVLESIKIWQEMLQMAVVSLQAINILLSFLCHMRTQCTVWWIMVVGSWWVFSWQPAVPANSLAVPDNLWTQMELRSRRALTVFDKQTVHFPLLVPGWALTLNQCHLQIDDDLCIPSTPVTPMWPQPSLCQLCQLVMLQHCSAPSDS